MFIKKASEANLAEIELAQLALQRASSERVKEFAQTMIEHQTMAQTALASIVINHPTWAPNHVTDAQHKDAHKTATLGGTGGTVGNATAEGMTNGRYNSNLPARHSTE
jgi:putative membrane protein